MVDRDVYMEIVDFLISSGGAYRSLDSGTCRDLIDSLSNGQHRIVRDHAGELISFTSWWMIREEDLEIVKQGERPADITGGNIVYIADHAGGYHRIISFLRDTVGNIDSCWHHRFKDPAQFRFRRKERTNG